jgi:flagellar basal-body rod protein FlgF
MDKLIYVAMTGAKQILYQQGVVANNLANVGTTGYREETASFRAVPVQGDGLPTRVFTQDTTTGANLAPGAIQKTGRDLDVAVQGQGWLAVEGRDGQEAYTRNGSLQISPEGILQTRTGLNVLSEGGPLSIPANATVTIARDGTVSAVQAGQALKNIVTVGRLKLVNPPEGSLVKGQDGLFRTRDGQPADTSPEVALVSGALESSNVNAVETMVSMITLARQFEMQMKLLQNAESNARSADQLLAPTG